MVATPCPFEGDANKWLPPLVYSQGALINGCHPHVHLQAVIKKWLPPTVHSQGVIKNGCHLLSTRKWSYFGPKMVPKCAIYSPRQGRKWLKGGQKGGQKQPKNGSKVIQTFIKVHKNTQNPLKILTDIPTYCTLSQVETSILTVF